MPYLPASEISLADLGDAHARTYVWEDPLLKLDFEPSYQRDAVQSGFVAAVIYPTLLALQLLLFFFFFLICPLLHF